MHCAAYKVKHCGRMRILFVNKGQHWKVCASIAIIIILDNFYTPYNHTDFGEKV